MKTVISAPVDRSAGPRVIEHDGPVADDEGDAK
jgi:hypothetical protein